MKISTTLIRNNVMVRVAFSNNLRKHYNTGVKVVRREEWGKGVIVNRPDAVSLNAIIGNKVSEVQRAILRLEAQGIDVNPDNLTEAITCEAPVGNFLEYMEHRIFERALRENSQRNAMIALGALQRFGRIQSFASLTVENVMLFDRFLREEDPSRKQSTIYGYHKLIKPYVAEAVMMRKIKENPYTFFETKKGTTPPRQPLTEQELQIIVSASLPPIYAKAQDIFIFQAYTGLSYADAMEFNSDMIMYKEGHAFIAQKRKKTATSFYTPILPHAEAVLLKYGDRLPRLSNQKYNMHLHAIEGILGIKKPLTSHVARHSFATLMLSYDIPIPVVSRMLGHTDINTTQIYAKITAEKIEDATRKLWSDLE